jgi:hypothetical protein
MSRKRLRFILTRRDQKMRTIVLILSLLSAAAVLAATPAAACPEGYQPCGDFCCGAPPPAAP